MKKVVIFGAAGHTGKYITRKMQSVQALPSAWPTLWKTNPLAQARVWALRTESVSAAFGRLLFFLASRQILCYTVVSNK